MKKNLFISFLAVVIAISALISINSYSEIKSNALFYDNLEALADSEGGGEICYNSITTVEGGQYVLYCGSCTVVKGNPIIFSGTGFCKTINN